MWLRGRNATGALPVLQECPRQKLTAGFSSFLLQTQKEWGNVFGGEKENPSAWYVCPCESVFGSRGQVLALRNSIRVFLSSVLKVPQGWSWRNGGSPAARTWIWWPSGHSCWRDWALFQGECVIHQLPGQWQGMGEVQNSEKPILTYSSFTGSSCLFIQERSACLWLLLCFLSPLHPPNSWCQSRLLCVSDKVFLTRNIPQNEAEKCLWDLRCAACWAARAPALHPALLSCPGQLS